MAKKTLDVRSLTGADILPILPDLARLRIVVFRDWPYLYDGTLDYEEKYLATFAAAKGACRHRRLRRGRDGRRLDRRADDRARG